MTSILTTPSVALAILQRLNASATTPQQPQSSADNLIAIATGQTGQIAASKQPTQAQSKISEAFFNADSNASITKMKLDLIERTGKALGVEKDDYVSMDDFVAAMKKAYGEIKVQPGGAAIIHGLEKELGLDKLGVSLEDVINSAGDGENNDTLTQALERQLNPGKENKDDGQSTAVNLSQASQYGLLSFY